MNFAHSVFAQGRLYFVLLGVGIIIGWGCNGGGPEHTNVHPITRVSNVPPPEDTITTKNPRLKLYWVGDDPDGFVTGFRYRWSFRLSKNDPFQYKPYKTLLNILIKGFALMAVTDDPKAIPDVYRFFSTLPPEGLDLARTYSLTIGDSILVAGVKVFASNSDYVVVPNSNPPLRAKNEFPVHVNPNSGIFIFDSQDTLNFHTFEIEAIDNLGAISDQPALVSFQTPIVSPPHAEITEPPPDTSLILLHRTETFGGVRFGFIGFDPNSRTIDYSWVVDKDIWLARTGKIPWSDFSPKQEVYVTASDFPDPYAIDHTFYVRARNEFGSIDTIGFFTRVIRASNGDSLGLDTVRASRTFHTIYPTFVPPFNSKRILIIDNNYSDTARASASHPTREMIDNYYTGILDDLGRSGQYDITLVIDPPPFQPKYVTYSDLGKYSLVIFVADGVDGFFNNHHYSTFSRQQILFNYCAVGGKLIMSGWSWRSPLNSQLTTFYTDIIHVGTRGVINGAKDFLGVRGQQGYPDAYLDPAKLDTAWGGTLSNTYLSYPYGFGEFVQNFDSKKDSILFENQPMAVRYIGVTFNTVYFSFPLYFIDRPSTVSILRKALQDIGE